MYFIQNIFQQVLSRSMKSGTSIIRLSIFFFPSDKFKKLNKTWLCKKLYI